jgi:hypothetical protein
MQMRQSLKLLWPRVAILILYCTSSLSILDRINLRKLILEITKDK